jgi:hypothetical protein
LAPGGDVAVPEDPPAAQARPVKKRRDARARKRGVSFGIFDTVEPR